MKKQEKKSFKEARADFKETWKNLPQKNKMSFLAFVFSVAGVILVFWIGSSIDLTPSTAKEFLKKNGLAKNKIELVEKNDVRFITKADGVYYNGIINDGKLVAMFVGGTYGGGFCIYDTRDGDTVVDDKEKSAIMVAKSFYLGYDGWYQIPNYLLTDIKSRLVAPDSLKIQNVKAWTRGYKIICLVTFQSKNAFGATISNSIKYELDCNTGKFKVIG